MAEGTSDTKLTKGVPKHDWYQTEAFVVISVMIKNVKEEQLKIDVTDTNVVMVVTDYDGKDLSLKFNLAHEIRSDALNYIISPSKIELKLMKKDGFRWDTLEGDPHVHAPKTISKSGIPLAGPPPYPTSKIGKDWSAIEKDIKQQEANEKPEGEEALNKLFQEIYGKGSDEVKRAMNKSYMESGGTVLSTNWKEISKQKVDVKPPDGMEWKKW